MTSAAVSSLDRTLAALVGSAAFAELLDALRAVEWVIYAKRPFAGPQQVLAYLGRYTHRIAMANSRLTRLADGQVDFTWKDYRHHGKTKVMTLAADEFIRRFLLHAVPHGFHRIRHIGLLANGHRAAKLRCAVPPDPPTLESYRSDPPADRPCTRCLSGLRWREAGARTAAAPVRRTSSAVSSRAASAWRIRSAALPAATSVFAAAASTRLSGFAMDWLSSYRREGPGTGRMAGFICRGQ